MGEYTSGQNDEVKSIDYDYSIMKYEVTNKQYVTFLNEELANGNISIQPANGELARQVVMGPYDGDEGHEQGDHPFLGLYSSNALCSPPAVTNKIRYEEDQFTIEAGFENHPAVWVTWVGAKVFASRHQASLPTIDEWERAARGDSGFEYPWGDGIDGSYANYLDSGDPFESHFCQYPWTTPVGYDDGQTHNGFSTNDNSSPFGLYDMAGNAAEWTEHSSGAWATTKGGSWFDFSVSMLTSWRGATRSGVIFDVGFRLVQRE